MTIAVEHIPWIGSIELPDHFRATADEKRAVKQLVNARWPFEVDIQWQTTRAPFQAILREAPTFPGKVHFEDLREEIDACKPGEIVIGLTARREVYKGSFLTDDPHWGFAVGSRRGKSTFLSWCAAQILHQDPEAGVTGIDVKRESFKALFGVPGLTLANNPRDILEMWDRVREFREEMDRRCDARGEDPTLEFPFRVLMIDEVSQFSAQSKSLWRKIKKQGEQAYPPVWDDVAAVFWQGAAFHCHVLLCGQRLDDTTTGGIGLNTSLGLRGLAGFWPRDWMRLVGTTPIPLSRRERGRWIYANGESETWVQNLYGTDDEIRDWAMAGRLPRPRTAPEAAQAWVTGLDAAAEHLGITKAAFVQRRHRAPGHKLPGEDRHGNQPAWRVTDLEAWASPGALVASQGSAEQ